MKQLIDICVWHKGENNMTDLKLLEEAFKKLNIHYKKLNRTNGTTCLLIDERVEPKVSKGLEYESKAYFEFNIDESLLEMDFSGA